MLLRRPFMSADSLVGATDLGRNATSVRVAIPTTRIRTLEVPKFSIMGTVGLVLGLSLITLVTLAFLVASSLES